MACLSVVLVDVAIRFVLPGSRGRLLDIVVLCGLGLLYYAVLLLCGRLMGKGPSLTAFSVLRELRILI